MTTRKYIVGGSWGAWDIIDYPYASKRVLLRCVTCSIERWCSVSNMSKTKEQKCRLCSQDFTGCKKTYYSVRARAKSRQKDFSFSYEEWVALVTKNCHYCGSEPSNAMHGFKYSGIDRVDSQRPYMEDNCVPCCKICNRAKSDLTVEEFHAWTKKLMVNHGYNPSENNTR